MVMLARRMMMKAAASPVGDEALFYKFEDAGNLGLDSGSLGWNMSLSVGSIAQVVGQVGFALGQTAAQMESAAQTPINGSDITLAGWFKPQADFNDLFTLYKFATGSTLSLDVESGGKVRAVYRDTGGAVIGLSTIGLSFGTWYFMSARYEHSTLNIKSWIPQAATPTQIGTMASALQDISSTRTTPSFRTTSEIDEVRMWTRYLSDAELLAIYNAEK